MYSGESAGGNLAAVVIAVNLDTVYTPVEDRVSVIGAALAYPITNMGVETHSYQQYGAMNGMLTTGENCVCVFVLHVYVVCYVCVCMRECVCS